jgi:hypothetical protein
VPFNAEIERRAKFPSFYTPQGFWDTNEKKVNANGKEDEAMDNQRYIKEKQSLGTLRQTLTEIDSECVCEQQNEKNFQLFLKFHSSNN